jgi:ribosomal protein L31
VTELGRPTQLNVPEFMSREFDSKLLSGEHKFFSELQKSIEREKSVEGFLKKLGDAEDKIKQYVT